MTNDQNAPERIGYYLNSRGDRFWTTTESNWEVGYVRADIHEAVVKELDEQCRLHGIGANREAKLIAERDALQRQLAQCRREALEGAAKVCDDMEPWIQADGTSADAPAWFCAEEIRKLIEKEGVK